MPIEEVKDQSVADMIENAISEVSPWRVFGSIRSRKAVMRSGFRDVIEQYLFGLHLWEITKDEATLDEEQLRLVFLDAIDRDRRKFERLRRKFSGEAGQAISAREAIPEEVRIFVWRRDEGKCTKCGSQERLEFDHIIPVAKGGSSTARNIQLLCERCNRQKRDHI